MRTAAVPSILPKTSRSET